MSEAARADRPWRLFWIFLRLGLTSFGGPVAHLGFFRSEFVQRRAWLDERSYADLVALCQFLPGPASSQVGMAIGLQRGGLWGALAAWLGFTLPSALALTLFALGLARHGDWLASGWLQGLKLAAVAVVAQAVWGMGRSLCPDGRRRLLALAAALACLSFPGAWTQLALIAGCGLAGWLWLRLPGGMPSPHIPYPVSARLGATLLALAGVLLLGLPLLAAALQSPTLAMLDGFYRAGALVFGGGHVVLPLLQQQLLPTGVLSEAEFLAGYGAAQAVPGPLFSFAAYLGALMQGPGAGVLGGGLGALLCLLAIFMPAALLVLGALPFWDRLRQRPALQQALAGTNAGVVGLLLAALYDPVLRSAIHGPLDLVLALAGLALLVYWRVSPLWVVGLLALAGQMFG